MGPVPVAKVCLAAKEGVAAPGAVVFSSTDTLLSPWLATTRSGLPSPLRSATATERGVRSRWRRSALGGEGGRGRSRRRRVQQHRHRGGAVVGDDEVGLAVAVEVADRHGVRRLSRWRSPPWWRRRAWSRPAPSCSAAPTRVLSPRLATTRSGLPSPLRSPTATEIGADPGGEGLLGGEGGRGRARRRRVQQHRHGVGVTVGDDEVGLAVAVEVADRHGDGQPTPVAKSALGGEGRRGRARRRRVQQHRHAVQRSCWRRRGRACRRR